MAIYMTKIKKFESFSTRIPERVTRDVWYKKRMMYRQIPFSKEEIDFFQKLGEENVDSITDISLSAEGFPLLGPILNTGKLENIYIQFPTEEIDDINNIEITKLEDYWYLIHKESEFEEFFICDEWEEVLGYLSSKTNLSF